MKIADVRVILADIPVKRPHKMSFTTLEAVNFAFVRLETADGLVGWGEAFPHRVWRAVRSLVETLIAASIIYMAVENIVAASLLRRWLVTAIFGLVHGFGFSFALGEELQFAGGHLVLSLLAFNVGIELGQILFVAALLPLLAWLARWPLASRYALLTVSVAIALVAGYWMVERAQALALTPVQWLSVVLILGGIGCWLVGRSRRQAARTATRTLSRAMSAARRLEVSVGFCSREMSTQRLSSAGSGLSSGMSVPGLASRSYFCPVISCS